MPVDLGLDVVHQLHRLEDAERLPGRDGVALLDERRLRPAGARGRTCRPSAPRRGRRRRARGRGGAASGSSRSPAAADAASARLRRRPAVRRTETRMPCSSIVTSPTPDSWTIRTTSRMRSAWRWSTPAGRERSRLAGRGRGSTAAAARPPRRTARAGAAPPRSTARPSARSRSALEVDGSVLERRAGREQLDGAARRPGRSGPAGCRSGPRARPRSSSTTVLVAVADEHVAAAPASRGSGRSAPRAAASRPRSRICCQLVEHLVEAVAGGVRAQLGVEQRRRARRAGGAPAARTAIRGGERRDRLVADVLVDELRRLPQRVDVDARVEPEARRAPARLPRPRRGASVSATG